MSEMQNKIAEVVKALDAVGYDIGFKSAYTIAPGPTGSDINDNMVKFGWVAVSEFARNAVNNYSKINKPKDSEKFFISSKELAENTVAPQWLIKGILPEKGLCGLVGETGGYKSFGLIEMGESLARGVDFFGRKSKQVNVLFALGEGRHGITARQKGLQIARGYSDYPENLYICGAFDMLSKPACQMVSDFIKENDIGAIFIDTFARSFHGEENSAKDMSEGVGNMEEFFIKAGATVVCVHHTGHGSKDRARGSSVWRAALDAEIGFVKSDGGITVKCWKQKDAEPFEDMHFQRRIVETGLVDEDGINITTLVLEQCDAPAPKPLELNNEQKRIVATLRGTVQPFNFELAFSNVSNLISSSNRRQSLKRLLDRLTKSHELKEFEGFYRFV